MHRGFYTKLVRNWIHLFQVLVVVLILVGIHGGNSTLSGCGLPNSIQWEGIVFKESGLFTNETSTTSITIRNNSVISDAENGLNIRAPYNRPSIISLDISNTTFKNNFNGVKLWDKVSCEFEIKIRNSKFLENDRGISLRGCDLATVTKSEFSNCDYGIHMHDSYLKLTNDNKLTENTFGVYSRGTHPLAGGFLIGDQNTKFNTFERNKTNIVAQANNHPLGADIVNNYMDNTLSPVSISGGNFESIPLSTLIYGDCKSKFLNNTTVYTGIGSMNYANGENINRVGCNEYKQIYFTDVDVRFENSMTQVLQNNFVDTYASVGNIKLFSADIDDQQGSPENPAGNCFNEEDLKRLISEGLVGESTYFHKNEGLTSCLYPGNEHELSLFSVEEESRHCIDQNIGIFTIAPPPPIDVELPPEFLPPLTYTPNDDDDCFPCIKNEVTTLINQIINNSGDNPYTYLPEPDQNPLANSIPNEQLDDAIHRGIYLAMNTQNVIFGEEILIPIKKWYYQIRLFGLYVYLEEYSKAEAFLNALQPIEANEIAFVEVQRITLESLMLIDFEISPSQITKLVEVSESTLPAAGYARSLHYKLTGIDLPINFYDDRYNYNPRSRNNDIKEDNVSIYPNPANTELKIKSDRDITSISIINIHGKTVLRVSTDISEKEHVIDVSDYQEGIYFVRLEMANGTITNSKVIIK
jgi:hypothetical protein